MPTATELYQDECGMPLDVLKLRETELPDLKDGEVLIEMLASPINPSDVYTVMGIYPIKPELPGGITGHEGVGKVIAASSTSDLAVGDVVVPIASNQGVWRSHGIFKAAGWSKLKHDIPLADAATIIINPGTALLMLEQYVDLKAGDCVVQNGANSQVGLHVIAICKQRGIKNIAVVRERSDEAAQKELVDELTAQGADLVVSHEKLKEALKDSGLPAPKLALDCIAGDSACSLAESLAHSGTLVNYGMMSLKPMSLPAPAFIFNDVRVRGFWIAAQMREQGHDWLVDLVDRLTDLIKEGIISSPKPREFKLSDWKAAFEAQQASGPKVMFVGGN